MAQGDQLSLTHDLRSLVADVRLTVRSFRASIPKLVRQEVRTELLLAEPDHRQPLPMDLIAQASVLSAFLDNRLRPSSTTLAESAFWGALHRAIFVVCRDSETAGITPTLAFIRAALGDQDVRGPRVEDVLRDIENAPFHAPATLHGKHIPRLLDLDKRRRLIEALDQCTALLRVTCVNIEEVASTLHLALEVCDD